jgi:TolB-like protein/Flp pilus assembly protein TadD
VPEGRLDSWKEIAAHLGRSVRTVQRWERQEGLPVHRLQHEKQGSVYALVSELDAWWEERRVGLDAAGVEAGGEPAEERAEAPGEVAAPALKAPAPPAAAGSPSLVRRGLAFVAFAGVAGALGLAVRHRERTPEHPRLAILPFANLTGSPDREYITDGLTEELIADLGRVRDLGVIARTSVMRFKATDKTVAEIARELRVDYLLEGSVREAGTRLRVTAQLIRTSDESHLWAETYDRELHDLLAVQAEVALRVAREVRPLMPPPKRPGVDGEVYLAYLRGRHYWNQRTEEGFRTAILEFERALARDPRYAPAWSGLADAQALLSNYGLAAPREAMPRAREAAGKAVSLDGSLAEGHASLGHVLASYDWDFAAAEREFRLALEKNPNYAAAWFWYGLMLGRLGRYEEAHAAFARGLDADPLSPTLRAGLDNQDFFERRFDAALRRSREILVLSPDQAFRVLDVARAEAGLGRFADAVRSMRRACELRPGTAMLEAYLAYAQARSGQKDEAEAALRRLEADAERRHVPPYYLALVATGLGDSDRALAFLERAYEERHVGALSIRQDPEFDSLRADPRFQDLLRRAGLGG